MGETATGTVERTVDPGGIVDTDILVDVLREVTAAITFLRDAERYVTVTAITQMELIQGSRNRAKDRQIKRPFLPPAHCNAAPPGESTPATPAGQ